MANRLLEKYVQVVRMDGLNTNKNVVIGKTATANLTVNGTLTTGPGGNVIVPIYEFVEDFQSGQSAASWASNHTCFVNGTTATWKIIGVNVVFSTAGGAGATITAEVATGTTAMGSGVAQLTAPIPLTGAANTTVTGTLLASPTTITAGARVNLIFAGTVTGLANACVEIEFQRLS